MTSEFLVNPITRFDPAEDPSLRSFIEALGRTGGQPRRLASALSLWNAMIARDRVIFCAVAGAPVPLGFGPAIASLIERGQSTCWTLPARSSPTTCSKSSAAGTSRAM